MCHIKRRLATSTGHHFDGARITSQWIEVVAAGHWPQQQNKQYSDKNTYNGFNEWQSLLFRPFTKFLRGTFHFCSFLYMVSNPINCNISHRTDTDFPLIYCIFLLIIGVIWIYLNCTFFSGRSFRDKIAHSFIFSLYLNFLNSLYMKRNYRYLGGRLFFVKSKEIMPADIFRKKMNTSNNMSTTTLMPFSYFLVLILIQQTLFRKNKAFFNLDFHHLFLHVPRGQ